MSYMYLFLKSLSKITKSTIVSDNFDSDFSYFKILKHLLFVSLIVLFIIKQFCLFAKQSVMYVWQ